MSLLVSSRRSPVWKPQPGSLLSASHPIANGIVACYLMNEGGGLVLNSAVNNGLMQMTGATTLPWQAGFWGRATGSTVGELRCTSNPNSLVDDLPLGRGFSILLWVQTPGNNVVLRKTVAGTNNTPGWTFQNDGAGTWIFRLQTTSAQCNGTSNAVFPVTGPFYQVVWTYNGAGHLTASNHVIYYNGQPAGFSASTNGTGTYNSDSANPLALVAGTSQRDHCIIWNRGLSAAEVQELYISPFCFMAPAQRSRIYQVGGLTPDDSLPIIFVVT